MRGPSLSLLLILAADSQAHAEERVASRPGDRPNSGNISVGDTITELSDRMHKQLRSTNNINLDRSVLAKSSQVATVPSAGARALVPRIRSPQFHVLGRQFRPFTKAVAEELSEQGSEAVVQGSEKPEQRRSRKPRKLPKTFQELKIDSVLIGQLSKTKKIIKPTLIQVAAAPEILRKTWNPEGLPVHDLLIEDETGGGKTLAFMLPILTNVDNYNPNLQAIICAHNKALVLQIAKVVQQLCEGGKKSRKQNPVKVMAIEGTGKGDMLSKKELRKFQTSTPHILIATPTMAEFLISNSEDVLLDDLLAVVFDETDQLLSMKDNREGAVKLLTRARDHDAQKIFASATMTGDVDYFSKQYMDSPKRVRAPVLSVHGDTERKEKLPDRLSHWVFVLKETSFEYKMKKLFQLHKCLRFYRLAPGSGQSIDTTTLLVFINNPVQMAEAVEYLRSRHGMRVRSLGGRTTRDQFSNVLEELERGGLDVLVSSDVLARGMDMYGITDVVNFDPPQSANMYLHRAGRAGRMQGKFSQQSHVVNFVTQSDKVKTDDQINSLGGQWQRIFIADDKITYGT